MNFMIIKSTCTEVANKMNMQALVKINANVSGQFSNGTLITQ